MNEGRAFRFALKATHWGRTGFEAFSAGETGGWLQQSFRSPVVSRPIPSRAFSGVKAPYEIRSAQPSA